MPANSNKILERLRKLEFTHSPSMIEQEFGVIRALLPQTTRNLNRVRIDHFKVMETINDVGLNSFIKLKKLRLEHLESDPRHEDTYTNFIRHLKTNTSVTFIKVERIFTRDHNKLLMLIDALKTSRVKKMVLWLCRRHSSEATDQLCQFLHCKRLQCLKVRRFDHKRTDLDLLQVLIAINLHASALKELYLEEWDFSQESVVNVINTYLSDLCWYSTNLLTLRVNRQTFEAFAWKLKSRVSANHVFTEQRSALEDMCTLSLTAKIEESSPPEFQPDWLTRLQATEGSEGQSLRKRLKCDVSTQPAEQGDYGLTTIDYRLPILRLITTGMKKVSENNQAN